MTQQLPLFNTPTPHGYAEHGAPIFMGPTQEDGLPVRDASKATAGIVPTLRTAAPAPGTPPAPPPHFGGVTYDPVLDGPRLTGQLKRVRDFMLDYEWHTLKEILVACAPGKEQAMSARIRDLRKEEFGGYIMPRERVRGGLWIYRMEPR